MRSRRSFRLLASLTLLGVEGFVGCDHYRYRELPEKPWFCLPGQYEVELYKRLPGSKCPAEYAFPEGLRFVVEQTEEPSPEGCASWSLSLVSGPEGVEGLELITSPTHPVSPRDLGLQNGYTDFSFQRRHSGCPSRAGFDAYFLAGTASWEDALDGYGVTWAVVVREVVPDTCPRLSECTEIFASRMTRVGEWSGVAQRGEGGAAP